MISQPQVPCARYIRCHMPIQLCSCDPYSRLGERWAERPLYCHTTNGPPGPSVAAMDGPGRPFMATTLDPEGTIYGTSHHHSWSP